MDPAAPSAPAPTIVPGAVVPGSWLVLEQVVSPVFGATCWLVGEHGGGACVIVDPGARVTDAVRDVVSRHGWDPVAVLATHGHLDHVADAAGLSAHYGVPVRLHAADAYRLDDPFGTIERPGTSGALVAALRSSGVAPEDYRAPRAVETFGTVPHAPGGTGADAGTAPGPARDLPLAVPGLGPLALRAVHAPGHTQGSTLYLADDVDLAVLGAGGGPTGAGGARHGVALTGDVLFAGTIGRTDLPGGDHAVMQRTLRDVIGHSGATGDVLDGGRVVLPGHGPASSVAHERRTNPYLRG